MTDEEDGGYWLLRNTGIVFLRIPTRADLEMATANPKGFAELVSPATKPHQGSATMYGLYVPYKTKLNWDLEQSTLDDNVYPSM